METSKFDYCKACGFLLPEKIKRWADYCSECYSVGYIFNKVIKK